MDNKEAKVIGNLENSPRFQMLNGLTSELIQAQDNAIDHKHKALHMGLINYAQMATKQVKHHHLGNQAPKKAPKSNRKAPAPPASEPTPPTIPKTAGKASAKTIQSLKTYVNELNAYIKALVKEGRLSPQKANMYESGLRYETTQIPKATTDTQLQTILTRITTNDVPSPGPGPSPGPTPKPPTPPKPLPPSQSGGDTGFDPSKWPPINSGNAQHYYTLMCMLYDKLMTTGAKNPNILMFLLEAISKLSAASGVKTSGGNTIGQLVKAFTARLLSSRGMLSSFFTHGQPGSPASLGYIISQLLATLAIYQNPGGSPSSIMAYIEKNYLGGMLQGNNPFLASIRGYLSKDCNISSITALANELKDDSSGDINRYGIPTISKVMMEEIMESIAYGGQDGGPSDQSQAEVRSTFLTDFLAAFKNMQAKGDCTQLLLAFVMMNYNMCSDQAGSYQNNIGDLTGLDSDTSEALGVFTPGEFNAGLNTANVNYMAESTRNIENLLNMWTNSPNFANGGSGSVTDIIKNNLEADLSNIKVTPAILKSLPQPPKGTTVTYSYATKDRGMTSATYTFPDGSKRTIWANTISTPPHVDSLLSVMNMFENYNRGPQSNATNAAGRTVGATALISIISGYNNEATTMPDGSVIYKRDPLMDSTTSTIQSLESQISSANETAKAQYQSKNQVSANMLSTVGDMMKDITKDFTTAVQNERV